MKLLKLKPHYTENEISEILKNQKDLRSFKFWQVINSVSKKTSKTATEISEILGISKSKIYSTVRQYNKYGKDYKVNKNWGGRRKGTYYLTIEEEMNFFSGLTDKALKGEILSFKDIKEEIELLLNREVSEDYIWDLFKRNQWHKISPRPKHPLSDIEVQKEFKKNSQRIWIPKS
jgi:transposase